MKTKSIIATVTLVVTLILGLSSIGYGQLASSGGSGSGGTTAGGSSSDGSGTTTIASGAPATLPIGSADDLRNYALGLVAQGSRYVTSPSMLWSPGTFTYTNTSGAYAEDVLDKLFGAEFLYQQSNPLDVITGYVWLYSTNGNDMLFYGSAQYTEADLQKSKPMYTIWQQSVPLLTNVLSAQVLALNPDGSSSANTYQVGINSLGQLLFPPWMAGVLNGLLVVQFNDGTIATYRLSNPHDQIPGQTTETSAYKVDGHYVYEPGATDKPTVLMSIIELYNKPTAFWNFPVAEQVTVDVTGVVQSNGQTSFERPPALIATSLATGLSITNSLNATGPTVLNVPAGKSRIKFNWINFGQPGLLYTGPTGPVGVGAVPVSSK